MPNEVDPVLESLIVGMLATNVDDRFTILQIKDHDWLKKKHPMDAPSVTITPRDPEDPMMSTSVIPYLVDLHFGDEASNQLMANNEQLLDEHLEHQNENHDQKKDFITEHDLREQSRLKEIEKHDRETRNANVSSANRTGRSHNLQADKNKTTKCIKVKKMSNCSIS